MKALRRSWGRHCSLRRVRQQCLEHLGCQRHHLEGRAPRQVLEQARLQRSRTVGDRLDAELSLQSHQWCKLWGACESSEVFVLQEV